MILLPNPLIFHNFHAPKFLPAVHKLLKRVKCSRIRRNKDYVRNWKVVCAEFFSCRASQAAAAVKRRIVIAFFQVVFFMHLSSKRSGFLAAEIFAILFLEFSVKR